MTSPAYSILYSAVVHASAATGAAGDVLLPVSAGGSFVLATTANRGTQRSTGIALSAYTAGGVVDIQQEGFVAATLSGLGAGTASYVRCSATGTLERVTTPGATDDVVGWCETDGSLHLRCGQPPGGYGVGTAVLPISLTTGVSGVLPTANQAAQAMAGDVTGTTAAAVVAKVNGVTYPVIGSAATGNSAYVSGAGTVAYSALNLAGGSGWVTGLLPAASIAAGTNTYVLTTTAGVAGWAAAAAGSPAGSTGEIQYNNAGAFGGATGVLAGVGYISMGSTPAAASVGDIRFDDSAKIYGRRTDNAVDIALLELGASSYLYVGDVNQTVNIYGTYAAHYFRVGASDTMTLNGTNVLVAQPIIGDTTYSSPFAMNGHSSIAFAGAGNMTVAAADYALSSNVFTGARTAIGTATYPAATDAGAYYKWVQNSTTGGFNVTITTGAGTTQALGAGGTPHYFRFDASGIVLLV